MTRLIDAHGRQIRDLRISITDRCNFRCLYCLPETEEAANFYKRTSSGAPKPIQHKLKPRSHFLTYEEITRAVRLASDLGVNKIRLTGGEPLLRRDVPRLVESIATLPGIEDLALTTNGFLFAKHARALRDAAELRAGLVDATEVDAAPGAGREVAAEGGLLDRHRASQRQEQNLPPCPGRILATSTLPWVATAHTNMNVPATAPKIESRSAALSLRSARSALYLMSSMRTASIGAYSVLFSCARAQRL